MSLCQNELQARRQVTGPPQPFLSLSVLINDQSKQGTVDILALNVSVKHDVWNLDQVHSPSQADYAESISERMEQCNS